MSHHHIQIFHLRTEQACWKCPICQQFWKVLQTVPFFFVTHSGTCSGRPCPPCPPYPAAFYPDARKMWSSTWIFSLHRLQSFYEGREASTREDHLPRGKRRMNEINGLPNLLSCSHNRTLFKIGLLHSLKVVVLLTKRGHTTSSSPNNRVALDNSIRNSSPLSLSTCLLQPFIGGSKHCAAFWSLVLKSTQLKIWGPSPPSSPPISLS